MTDDRAAQVVAAARGKKPVARVGAVARFEIEILGVNVLGIFGEPSDRFGGVVVRAQEVAHIDEQPEVFVAHGVHQLLHPAGFLAEKAVVLHHGDDPLRLGVFRHLAAAVRQNRQSGVEALVFRLSALEAARRIVPHALRAERFRHIDLPEQALGLRLPAVRRVEEIRADGIVDDGDAAFVRLFGEQSGVFQIAQTVFGLQVGEFDAVKAHVLGFLDQTELGVPALVQPAGKAVRTDCKLHVTSILSGN